LIVVAAAVAIPSLASARSKYADDEHLTKAAAQLIDDACKRDTRRVSVMQADFARRDIEAANDAFERGRVAAPRTTR
jgi:hypothetical protein